jgi:adenine deaminase
MPNKTHILSNLVDVHNREIKAVQLTIQNGIISEIVEINQKPSTYLLPGFIDAHVHVESSMLIPSEFARIAVTHGTIATISDPHEIANVLGIEGVEFMLENAKHTPFYFYFGAPSCVPATTFETAGAEITAQDLDYLLAKPEIVYLAEMMNFPGVIFQDEMVLDKLNVAKKHQKPIDGHAPGLKGEGMKSYFNSGISTDHESYEFEEAREKLIHGVKIMIREGSAARNFETLIPLIAEFPNQIMFCCDDKHPDNLIESHINDHVKRAIKKDYNVFDVIRAASINVIEHYNLPIGQLRVGDSADFIQVNN